MRRFHQKCLGSLRAGLSLPLEQWSLARLANLCHTKLYGTLTTVESSVVVGQIRLWTACVHWFHCAARERWCKSRPLALLESFRHLHVVFGSCSQKSSIIPWNIITHPYTYGCQSLYFTYSTYSIVSTGKANICQVQRNYSILLGYPFIHSIFWLTSIFFIRSD